VHRSQSTLCWWQIWLNLIDCRKKDYNNIYAIVFLRAEIEFQALNEKVREIKGMFKFVILKNVIKYLTKLQFNF
jgi:hypothetical protein